MSGTINGYEYVENTGVIVPDTGTVQADVQGEFTGTFGDDLNVDASTPQGALITGETLARSQVLANNATVANQINPNLAGGVFLDAIAALSGLTRAPETFTVVENVPLNGALSALIPAGSLAATAVGDQFATTADVTLDPVTGTALATFQAVEAGPVPCAANALETPSGGTGAIVTNVLGWESIGAHAKASVVGTLQQGDEPFRILRRNTLALQGISIIEAITSAVNNLEGVNGSTFLENDAASTQAITPPGDSGSISLVAHSIGFCVEGGVAGDIGLALLENKATGAAWNGSQSVTVVEPTSGQSYNVLYEIPTVKPVWVKATVRQGRFVGDPNSSVNKAILDYASNSLADFQGFIVGQSVSPFEISSAISFECPGIYVKEVQISLDGTTYVTTELHMNINWKATVISSNIDVIIVTS